MSARPNVILILTDDQGYGDMACHGNPWLQTPELDRLHAESVRLTDFHVDPMCAPTRAALMTGRYSSRAGVWATLHGRYYLSLDETTMAEVFAASGYATGMFGKWHLGDTWPYRPCDRGFQETLSFGGGVIGEIPDYWNNDYFRAVYLRNGAPERCADRYCTDVWFDEALAFIERHRHEPFFCYLTTNAPHAPHDVPDRFSAPYLALGLPADRARFYGMIASIDENVGRLRRRLAEWGLAGNTILLFLGDNGTAGGADVDRAGFLRAGYNAGMRGKKSWAFEGGHRNACFIHWPGGGLTGGRDVDCLSAHLDLLPTLTELCGLKQPDAPLDGRSLTALLRGERGGHGDDRALCVHNQQRDMPQKRKDFEVLTADWRLAQTTQWGPGRLELFGARRDPGQARDLAGERPDVVARLLAEYERWWESVSQRFGEAAAIHLGGAQNPVTITCHAWHSGKGLYSQRHVREGAADNGYWPLAVAAPGIYEFRLCRWPAEAATAMRAGLPPRPGAFGGSGLPSGRALPIVSARLKIGAFDQTVPVGPEDRAAVFRAPLGAGPARLETCLTDADGATRGAYYVYATRLGPT